MKCGGILGAEFCGGKGSLTLIWGLTALVGQEGVGG